jgi:hypothetical protein
VQQANSALRPYLADVANAARALRGLLDDDHFVSSLSAFVAAGGPGEVAWASSLLADATHLLAMHDLRDTADFAARLAAVLCHQDLPAPQPPSATQPPANDSAGDAPQQQSSETFSSTRFSPLRDALDSASAQFHLLDPPPTDGTHPDTQPRPEGATETPPEEPHTTDEELRERVETLGSFAEHASKTIELVCTATDGMLRHDRRLVTSLVSSDGVIRQFLERRCGARVARLLRSEMRLGAQELRTAWLHRHPAGESLEHFLSSHHANAAFLAISMHEGATHIVEGAHRLGEDVEQHLGTALEVVEKTCTIFNTLSITARVGLQMFSMDSRDPRVTEAQKDWLQVLGAVTENVKSHFEHAAEEAGTGTAARRAYNRTFGRIARVAGGVQVLISSASAYVDYKEMMHRLDESGWSAEVYEGMATTVGDIFGVLGEAFTVLGAPEIGMVLAGLGTFIGFVAGWVGEYLEEQRRNRWGEEALATEAYKRRLVLATRYVDADHAIPWFDEVAILPDDDRKLRVEARLPFPLDHDHFDTRPFFVMVRYAGYYVAATEGPDASGHRIPWTPLRLAPDPDRYFARDGYWVDALLEMEPKEGARGTWVARADESHATIDYELGWLTAEMVPASANDRHPDRNPPYQDPSREFIDSLPPITLAVAGTHDPTTNQPAVVGRPGVAIPIVAQVFTTGRFSGEEIFSIEDLKQRVVDRSRSPGNFPNAGTSQVMAFVPGANDSMTRAVRGSEVYVFGLGDADRIQAAGVPDGVSKVRPEPERHVSHTHHAAPGPTTATTQSPGDRADDADVE